MNDSVSTINTGIRSIVLQQIQQIAEKNNLQKVVLFGSRARGDFHERSDIDLAVSGRDLASFAATVDEETDTLLKYDIINLDEEVQQELLNAIQCEGIVLYEKV